jgi:hypothetical protein
MRDTREPPRGGLNVHERRRPLLLDAHDAIQAPDDRASGTASVPGCPSLPGIAENSDRAEAHQAGRSSLSEGRRSHASVVAPPTTTTYENAPRRPRHRTLWSFFDQNVRSRALMCELSYVVAVPRPELASLTIADPPRAWDALGFTVDDARMNQRSSEGARPSSLSHCSQSVGRSYSCGRGALGSPT